MKARTRHAIDLPDGSEIPADTVGIIVSVVEGDNEYEATELVVEFPNGVQVQDEADGFEPVTS